MAVLPLRWRSMRRPDDGNNWLALTRALLEAGELGEAREAARNAAKWTFDLDAALEVAQGLEKVKALDLAAGLMRAASTLAPTRVDLRVRLADLLLGADEVDDAADVLREAVERFPDEVGVRLALADTLVRVGAAGDAERQAERATEVAPERVEAWLALGRARRAAGNDTGAAEAVGRANTIAPEHEGAALALAEVHAERGAPREALELLRGVLERAPESAAALVQAGKAHAQLGESLAALRHLREAIRLRPDAPEAHCDLGAVQRSLGQVDAAILSFRSALGLAPTSAAAHLALGQTLRGTGADDAAHAHFEAAVRNAPPTDPHHVAAAAELRAMGAIALEEHAFALPPPDLDDDLDAEDPDDGETRAALAALDPVEPPPGVPLESLSAFEETTGSDEDEDDDAVDDLDDLDSVEWLPDDDGTADPTEELAPAPRAAELAERAAVDPAPAQTRPAAVEAVESAPPARARTVKIEPVDPPTRRSDSGPMPTVRVSRTANSMPPMTMVPTPPVAQRLSAEPSRPPPAAAFESPPAFTGNLRMFQLPNLMEFLRLNHCSGTLFVMGRRGTGEVRLRAGRLTGAAASKAPRLGDILVRTGQLKRDELEKVVTLQRAEESAESLGVLLLQHSRVTDRGLRAAVTSQVHAAMSELVQWEEGNFAFHMVDPGEAPVDDTPEVVRVDMSVEQVLLEAMRRLDEQRRT